MEEVSIVVLAVLSMVIIGTAGLTLSTAIDTESGVNSYVITTHSEPSESRIDNPKLDDLAYFETFNYGESFSSRSSSKPAEIEQSSAPDSTNDNTDNKQTHQMCVSYYDPQTNTFGNTQCQDVCD